MLFDLRGKRKRFVQVVYATLALLMGGGLILFGIGSDAPGGLSEIFGDGTNQAGQSFSEDADKIDERLKTDPRNEALLKELVRRRVSAGNNSADIDPATGQPIPTAEAETEYEAAIDAWDRYLAVAKGEPDPNVAQLASTAYITLATTATTQSEAEVNLEGAAETLKIVAAARPSVGTYSNLAYYSYAGLDFRGGDAAARKAEAEAANEGQKKSVRKQLAQIRKQAKAFEKQQAQLAQQQAGQGEEALENPLGGLSGAGGGLGATPTP